MRVFTAERQALDRRDRKAVGRISAHSVKSRRRVSVCGCGFARRPVPHNLPRRRSHFGSLLSPPVRVSFRRCVPPRRGSLLPTDHGTTASLVVASGNEGWFRCGCAGEGCRNVPPPLPFRGRASRSRATLKTALASSKPQRQKRRIVRLQRVRIGRLTIALQPTKTRHSK